MRTYQWTARAAVPVLAALTLGGCGMFKSSGIGGRIEPNDPSRVADRVQAVVTNTTSFVADAPTVVATFRATLYDKDGNQFYGPDVLLDGTKVDVSNPGSDTSTAYVKGDLPYAPGQTYTLAVQGNTATSPPAAPPIKITSPAPAKDDKGANLAYFTAEPGQPVTVTWTGGDPGQPVYIVLYGSPDKNGSRRLFVSDNPAMAPTDPLNFGKPIANTGSYTIPAELTERVQAADGSTTTRTVTTFDSPSKKGSAVTPVTISVVQRAESQSGPIHFATAAVGVATAGITPYK
jgi:hypothetical protein